MLLILVCISVDVGIYIYLTQSALTKQDVKTLREEIATHDFEQVTDKNEFVNVFKATSSLTELQLRLAFDRMDLNKNGSIEREEFEKCQWIVILPRS